MARWYGKVGYSVTGEVEPGVWAENEIETRLYAGDYSGFAWQNQNSGGINDNLVISGSVSIIADQYAYQNCSNIAYVEVEGTKWKVTKIEPQRPRLILSLGGVYNG